MIKNQSQVRKPKPKTVTVALLYSAGRGADDIRLRAYFSKCPREARCCWRWGIAAQWAMLAVALGCIQTLASGVWMAGSSLGHDGMNLWVILFGIWYYAIVHQCKIICVCVLAVPGPLQWRPRSFPSSSFAPTGYGPQPRLKSSAPRH